jgi:hypothetical protein
MPKTPKDNLRVAQRDADRVQRAQFQQEDLRMAHLTKSQQRNRHKNLKRCGKKEFKRGQGRVLFFTQTLAAEDPPDIDGSNSDNPVPGTSGIVAQGHDPDTFFSSEDDDPIEQIFAEAHTRRLQVLNERHQTLKEARRNARRQRGNQVQDTGAFFCLTALS